MLRNSLHLVLTFAVCFILAARAEVVDLRPVADTTLHEVNPNNNMGAHSHVAIGVTAKNTAARGLFRFDVSAIPSNAVVTTAALTFTLPRLLRDDPAASMHVVHRLLKPWGEGTKVGNVGAAGTSGEATWNYSANPTTWTAPGGQPGTDYESESSAREMIGPSPGEFTITSSSALVADVQHWIHNREQNFGWMIKVEDETVLQTARQFAARETDNGPILHLEYTIGTRPELRFTGIERAGTNIILRWTGGNGSVAVESTEDLSTTWAPLGQSGAGGFTNAAPSVRGYYRLRVD